MSDDKVAKLEKQIERLTKAFKKSKAEADKWKKYCKKAEDNLDEQMLLNEKLQEENKELFEDIKELKRKNESLTREVINKRKKEEEEEEEEEEVKKEEVKKEVCKMCGREKLSEHELWFPVKNLDGTKSFLCCGCGMSQF